MLLHAANSSVLPSADMPASAPPCRPLRVPVDATRQVFGIAVVSYVAVLLMVYHLRYTSYLKPMLGTPHASTP